jgi:hypothetical protein
VRTVEQLAEFFGMPAAAMAKTLLYEAVWKDREELVAVMMRGDLEINAVKLGNALDCLSVAGARRRAVPAPAARRCAARAASRSATSSSSARSTLRRWARRSRPRKARRRRL